MTTDHKWNDAIFYNTNEKIKEHYEKYKGSCYFILGKGFDPRMIPGLSLISKTLDDYDTLLINFSGRSRISSPIQEKMVKENIEKLKSIAPDYKELENPNTADLPIFFKENLIISEKYDRIIIDISSMPQSIYYNIIKQLVKFVNSQKQKKREIKLDIVACENSMLDDAIFPVDLDTVANYLVGFDTYYNSIESEINIIPVWFPLLGKSCQDDELRKLHNMLQPKEICPVLPFPSRNPRRSDEILSNLGERLFLDFKIDKRNIIYVAEQNVLDTYNKLHNAIYYYNEVLEEIGKPRFFVSTGSSKLIGLGTLLVHLELSESESNPRISFAHVKNGGYNFNDSDYNNSYNQVCLLCLEDNQYEW
jgi:hypothetical protein